MNDPDRNWRSRAVPDDDFDDEDLVAEASPSDWRSRALLDDGSDNPAPLVGHAPEAPSMPRLRRGDFGDIDVELQSETRPRTTPAGFTRGTMQSLPTVDVAADPRGVRPSTERVRDDAYSATTFSPTPQTSRNSAETTPVMFGVTPRDAEQFLGDYLTSPVGAVASRLSPAAERVFNSISSPETRRDAASGYSRGLTSGFSDEITGDAAQAMVDPERSMRREQGPVYTSVRDAARARQDEALARSPVATTIGMIGGGVAQMALPISGPARAATALGRIRQGAAVGGALGGLGGAGESRADNPLGVAFDALEGGAIGGAFGGTVSAIGEGVGGAARWAQRLLRDEGPPVLPQAAEAATPAATEAAAAAEVPPQPRRAVQPPQADPGAAVPDAMDGARDTHGITPENLVEELQRRADRAAVATIYGSSGARLGNSFPGRGSTRLGDPVRAINTPERVQQVADVLRRRGIRPGMGGTVERQERQAQTALETALRERKEALDRIVESGVRVPREDLAERYLQLASELDARNYEGQFDAIIDDILERGRRLETSVPEEGLGALAADALKQDLQDAVNWQGSTSAEVRAARARSSAVMAALDDASAQTVGSEVTDSFRRGRRDAGLLENQVLPILRDSVSRDQSWLPTSFGQIGGALASIPERMLRQRIPGIRWELAERALEEARQATGGTLTGAARQRALERAYGSLNGVQTPALRVLDRIGTPTSPRTVPRTMAQSLMQRLLGGEDE